MTTTVLRQLLCPSGPLGSHVVPNVITGFSMVEPIGDFTHSIFFRSFHAHSFVINHYSAFLGKTYLLVLLLVYCVC